jgi:hypothetical protein
MKRSTHLWPLRAVSVATFLATLFLAAASSRETIGERVASAVRPCDLDDHLCRHVRLAFSLSSGVDRWREPIRVATHGMSQNGRALLLDLLHGLAARADIQVEELAEGDEAKANFVFAVAPDLAALRKQPWIARLDMPSVSGGDTVRIQHESDRSTFLLIRPSDDLTRPRIEHCVGAATPERVQDKPGLLFARFIYRCLTGTRWSDEVKPSLLNLPASAEPLYAAPHARMAALDRVMLEAFYDRSLPVEHMKAANALNALLDRLRAAGFGPDGQQHAATK